jgi:hypothetical protein
VSSPSPAAASAVIDETEPTDLPQAETIESHAGEGSDQPAGRSAPAAAAAAAAARAGELELLPEEAEMLRHLSQWTAGHPAAAVVARPGPRRRPRNAAGRTARVGAGRGATRQAQAKAGAKDEPFSIVRMMLAAGTVFAIGLAAVALARGGL